MKKAAIILLFLMSITTVKSQDTVVAPVVDTIKHWTAKGTATLLFNQSTFSNWVVGGENNIAGNVGVNYDINYMKDMWSWDNKIIASYGIAKTGTSSFTKKTDDRLEFNSLLGRKFKPESKWYYSAFLNFKTQFTDGYEYTNDDNGAEIRTLRTSFFNPAYLSFGPGILWKQDDNLKINIAPATSKFTFVDKSFTLPDEAFFGVEEGKSMRYELGMNASVYYKLGVVANVTFENILNLYSNYLEDPQNVDIDYQLNITMKVNKFLSANINFQTIYDDNAYQGFQIRQVFGVGINYGF